MSEPYMIKQTITYSDGTETVIDYHQNESAEVIEESVAEATAVTSPEIEEEVSEDLKEELGDEPALETQSEIDEVPESTDGETKELFY